ncbi:MAG: pilus assembly protein TadG-related protein [Candidatus Korobacteraceae bacterium]
MKPFSRDEDGQVIVLVALGLTVLSLMAGLAIDIGYLRYEKQQMQKATDAGALAAAAVLLNYGSSASQGMLTDAATADVTANGFKNAAITVVNPPASGPFSGNTNYVQVQVQESFPVFFMHLGGWSTVPVRDTAVGSAVGNASGCVYALDSNAGDTGFLSESLVSFVTNCGIYVNSNAQTSGTVNAGGAEIGVVGTSTGSFTPTPVAVPSFIDPLGGLPMPAVPPGCQYPVNYHVTAPANLQAGVYCGITISGTGVVNFASGLYILNGNGLTVNTAMGIPTLNGTGVTFYNTYAQHPYAPINLSGSSGVLSAPTSGTYAGILALQDRSVLVGSSGSTFDNSNGEVYIGALYFPTTSLTYIGNSPNHFATLIVAWQVSISGTAVFDSYAGSFRPSPVHSAALVQ